MSDFLEAIDQLLASVTPQEQAVDHLVEGGTMERDAFSCSVEHLNEWARKAPRAGRMASFAEAADAGRRLRGAMQ